LPESAWDEGRVRVQRKKISNGISTGDLEVIGVFSIMDYNMETIAKTFGPGEFYLYMSPSPQKLWTVHSCKISVAPEFAVNAGFRPFGERAPDMPRLADIRTLDSMAKALEPGRSVTLGELGNFAETIVEQTVRRLQPPPPPQAYAAQGGSPPGMEQVIGFWNVMERIRADSQKDTLAMIKAAQGGRVDSGDDEEKDPFVAIIAEGMKALPGLLKLFIPQGIPAPQEPPPQPALAEAAPQTLEDIAVISNLTVSELARFRPMVNMLLPFIPTLLDMLEKNPDAKAIAGELVDWIPPAAGDLLVELAGFVVTRGQAVLSIIDPRLVNDQGAALIKELAAILVELQGGEPLK
jgi:hypothetical protein